MDSIRDSLIDNIKKRATSATLGTYLFFWLSYHWQAVITVFFVDESIIYQKFGLLKNEYISNYFIGINLWNDWGFYMGYIVPAFLTYIFIWKLPKLILVKAYKKEQWYKVEKRRIKLEEEKRIQVEAKDLAEQEVKTIEAEIKTSDKKKEAEKKDPKILWGREYRLLDRKGLEYLKNIFRCIYEFKGRILVQNDYSGMPPNFELDPNALRFADSNGLVAVVNNGDRIELTEKGRYFASNYDEDI